MADVVSLSTGEPLTVENGNVAVPDVVARLEELLAQAKRGEVRAIGFAIVRPDYNTSTMYACDAGDPCSHQLMAAISYLQHRYATHKVENSEPTGSSA